MIVCTVNSRICEKNWTRGSPCHLAAPNRWGVALGLSPLTIAKLHRAYPMLHSHSIGFSRPDRSENPM